MAGTTANISIRRDADCISFTQPNRETINAMREAERIAKDPSVKGYTDLDELFSDLKE